jgi:hypothetical protein
MAQVLECLLCKHEAEFKPSRNGTGRKVWRLDERGRTKAGKSRLHNVVEILSHNGGFNAVI